jgi:hypothetical protein
MRTLRLAVAVLLVAAASAGAADARITAHGQQKRAVIRAVLRVPTRCEDVWISSVNRSWATMYAAGTTRPVCPKYAYNDEWFLHQVSGKWRNVSAGDDFECPRPHRAPHVPYPVLRDLIGCD